MAFVVKDRIKETTTTTGTGGVYSLDGAATGGYQEFSVMSHYDVTYYACTDGTDWEVGEAYYDGTNNRLVRQAMIESSNSNSPVDWGAGTKDIFVTLPASKALVLDDNDDYNINGNDDIVFGADQASSFARLTLKHNGSASQITQSEPTVGTASLTVNTGRLQINGHGGYTHLIGDRISNNARVTLYGGSNTAVFRTSSAGAEALTNLSVAGNLTVNGTTTTVNSTTVTVDDPVFTLGGEAAPTTDDNKDRGIEFRWHDGSAAKLGFFGFDDSEGKLTFIPDATNTGEVFSGSVGTILANVEGSLTGNADTASTADFLTGLADPDADRLLMWDDSAGAHKFVTLGSNLAFSGTTLNATDTNTDTTYSAGTGLSLTGTTFANTAPDQTVSLTGSGATSISGTYPSFTISSTNTTYSAGTGLSLTGTTFANTAPDQTVTLTGAGATTISGTYPNFTITSTDTNTDTDTTYTAGSGLSLTGTTFANTAPDQTVTLTGSGATSISGTYPNFTITSTDTDTNTTYTAGTGLSLSGTEFAIDTTIVPRKGSSNTFEFNQEIEVPSTFAGYKQWSFVDTGGSDLGYLGYHGTQGTMELRNATSSRGVVVSGNSGVDLKIDDGSIAYTGVRVFKVGPNVTGTLDWNGSARAQANAAGLSVVGTLNTTGGVTATDTITASGGIIASEAIRQNQDSLTANGGNLNIDLSASNNFKITMTANTTFQFLNRNAGSYGNLIIVQDATGGRSFTLPSQCKTPVNGASIVQATNANEISILSYYVVDTNTILVNYIGDFA
jgi:hypothetical protein